ncbi:hypothetical protein N0V90_013276 [Kalmusia sp. IMI 367209]|nr:hypothetical protein N0V90_013276 [Kalmusia sp. IMI 367209]
MWFLEHDILFGGKRVWLRPGSQQLFGRTKHSEGNGAAAGKNVFIDNKNVSRKHMMIKVLDVPPVDGTKLHTRSQIEITDLSCRQGTVVDGDKTLKSSKESDGSITYNKTVLTGTKHVIKLSNSYPPFTVKWQDVVFTYASKEKKTNSQVNNRNVQLHAMDIKTSSEFVYGKTTHVVSQKRNLPKVLQALVSGSFVVTSEYLDAILNAAAPMDAEGNYVPSQLEEDFDTWWPQEKEYIPATGQEPVPRPDQMLAPDPMRSEVFSGLTFVFLNEAQHTSLHQVIAGGGGKALLFDIRPGETTVEEYVDYVRSVAGHKKRSRTNDSGLPVVTVRLPAYPDDLEQWAIDFVVGVDQALNQRSILQNEFLDAIVSKDTSTLRRPPSEVSQVESSMPTATRTQRSLRSREPTPASPSRAPSQAIQTTSVLPEEPAKPIPRKRPIRRGVTSRFTGFDDYEPPTQPQKFEDAPMEDVQESVPEEETPSQSAHATQTQRTTRSQPRTTVEVTAQLDQMFPAAAEIKRKRAATRAPSASVEPETQAATEKSKTKSQRVEQLQKERMRKLEKIEKDINIKEETRKQLAEAEERRRDEEEKMKEELDGVDISKLYVDVQIVDMPLRPHQDRPAARSQAQSHRWKPEWNGRKDFKQFRRRGEQRRVPAQRVMVAFKEAPPRKGFGDTFFMEDTQPVRTEQDEQRLKRRQGHAPDSESDREGGYRRKRAKPTEVINVEDSGSDEEEIPRPSGSTLRNSGRTQRVVETQLENTQSQRGSKKRGPMGVAAGQPSAKKSRPARRDEDSDEEETGFRFRRRG